ncbi:porin family protein [Gaetbulibacter sp. M235]|uniref:porin family protein n=1 Tax=Gaetbulibacter sp. M235 TaxID=3126510 RepID=UPI00374F4466
MNKKKLTLLFTLFLLTLKLFSQDISSGKFRIGLNFGANLFDLNKDDVFDRYKGKAGYTFGLSLEYKLSEFLSLTSDVNYDKKVMEMEDDLYRDVNGNMTLTTIKDKIKFAYINITLELRYYFKNKAFINIGGFYNLSLNIKNETVIKDTGESVTFWEYDKVIKNYDFGLSVGIGYRFSLDNKNHFLIKIKDELGLANIADYPNSSLTDLKTNTLKLILNWELPL